MQSLLELRREAIVSLYLARKQSVATLIRCIEDVKERSPRRLVLIRHIRVPGDGINPGLEEVLSAVIVCTAMYEMDLWMALGSSTDGVDVQAAEILSDLEGFVDGEVGEILVTEDCSNTVNHLSLTHTSRETERQTNNLPLGCKQRQLILAFVAEGTQLDPMDFAANQRRDLGDRGHALEKIFEGRVGISPMLIVGERLERSISIG